MKISAVCFALLIVCTLISCEESSSSDETISLRWVPSNWSKYGSGFSNFSIGDDGQLYALGFVNNGNGLPEFGVYKALKNYQWENILKTDYTQFNFGGEFTIFKNKVYYIRYERIGDQPYPHTLWKGSGTSTEKTEVNNSVSNVIAFKGKLVVTGEFTNGIISTYDDDLFTEIAHPTEPFGGRSYLVLQTDDRLYFRDNFGSYQYDGTSLTKVEIPWNIKAVDDQGQFYSVDYNQEKTQILKNREKVGDDLVNINISQIFFNKGKLIAMGQNLTTGLSATFHLEHNRWKPVPTTNNFNEVFEYNNRIFGSDDGGVIAELVIQ